MKHSGLLIFVFLFSLLITSCSKDSVNQNALLYYNDFESLQGWVNPPLTSIVKGNAHSGRYSVKVDAEHEYSNAFKLTFGEISSKPIKKVKITAWCLVKNTTAQANLVLGVNKANSDETILWNGIKIQDTVKEANKWVEVTGEVDLAGHGAVSDNVIDFYCWNNSKEEIYMDDVRLEFIE